jgi:glutathione S-transferase
VKLHWSPRSPFVRKVMVVIHERRLYDKIERIRSVASMTVPNETLALDNPLGKIPTLVLDDGSPLYDSRVICEYLNGLGSGPSLFPVDPARRLTALRRQALGDGFLDFMLLWRQERMERPPERQSPPHLDGFKRKFGWTMAALGKEAPKLAAEELTIGHIAIASALSYLDFRFPDLNWRDVSPPAAAWHKVFAQRSSMVATEIVDA